MRRVAESAVRASADGVAIAVARPGPGLAEGQDLAWRKEEPGDPGNGIPRGGSQAVRAARRDEAALLGEVLADAFAEDPVFAWLIPPQPPGQDNRLRTFFTSMSRSYLPPAAV